MTIRMTSIAIWALASLTWAGAPALAARSQVEFDGSWSDIDAGSAPACQGIFAASEYHTKHFLVGPTRRTIVTHFSREEEGGFFQGLSFVSNFGYNNDFLYEKTVTVEGYDYFVEIYGFIDADVVYMEAAVDALDADGLSVCRATAIYSGFN